MFCDQLCAPLPVGVPRSMNEYPVMSCPVGHATSTSEYSELTPVAMTVWFSAQAPMPPVS